MLNPPMDSILAGRITALRPAMRQHLFVLDQVPRRGRFLPTG
ncbi:hypothetical protein SBA3_1900010 [Candidatus Sulfopaludibacter sp. SbA3]|nr:hypothetical protein SBA3_1900010 [Candidatus Sulfopaludibacter sp. SbA3]